MPCLLVFSATERGTLRAHYESSADRLKLQLQNLGQTHPKTATIEQANLYFKDQQILLHNFLRQVAALIRQSKHETLPVETPITTIVSNNIQLSSSIVSSSSVSSSSTSTSFVPSSSVSSFPSTASSFTSSTTYPGSMPTSSSSFFQSKKPAVIKNEAPLELKRCIGEFQKLFDKHDYTFTVKRTQATQLVLQFTARKKIVESDEEITEQLLSAAIQLRQLANASGLLLNPNQFNLNWETWTLTINADSASIDGIAWLLQAASANYMSPDNSPSELEGICRVH